MVIGYSGAGKSTLAKTLSNVYEIPVLFMDKLQFEANWVERDPRLRDQDLLTFLKTHENWVIDGNYSASHFMDRIDLADHIYILDYPRVTCLKQVIKRYRTYRKKTRESIADGCTEKLDWAFIWWVIYKGRSKRRQRHYLWLRKTYPEKTMSFKNLKQLNVHLNTLGIHTE